jgi:hypothetical protein
MFPSVIPGQVVHIRVEGDRAVVYFEKVPLTLSTTDVAGVLRAFNQSDWGYFNQCWWLEHGHLREPSPVLPRLAAAIDPNRLYTVNDLLLLAAVAGYYQELDPRAIDWDRERLQMLIHVRECFKQTNDRLLQEGRERVNSWLGSLWSSALVGAQSIESETNDWILTTV